MNKDALNDEEKQEAKQNGFIIAGKAGTGKTTLLNAVFGKEVGVAKTSAKCVTKESKVYYYKLENGKCICLIDTPGLADDEKNFGQERIDDIHLEGIAKIISAEKIHIKGILFLVNFQNERFDSTEQDALLNYNKTFPLKRFWKSLIIIYSHYYGDEDGESKEEIKELRDESNSEIFSKLMEKVKNVSDVIEYKNLKIRYFNLASKPKTEKQKLNNIKYRDELEILIDELSKEEPLFRRVEVNHVENYKLNENGIKYNAEVELIEYFDFNDEPIKQTINVIKKEQIQENHYYSPTSWSCHQIEGGWGSNGEIVHEVNETKPDPKIVETKVESSLGKTVGRAAVGLGGGAAIGFAAAGIASIAMPVLAPAIYAVAGAGSYIWGKIAYKLFD